MIRLTATFLLLIAVNFSEGSGKNETRKDTCAKSSLMLTDDSSGVLYFSQSQNSCPVRLVVDFKCRIRFDVQDTAGIKTCLRLKRSDEEHVCYDEYPSGVGSPGCDVVYFLLDQDSTRTETESDDIRWYMSHTSNIVFAHCPITSKKILSLKLSDAVIKYSVHCYESITHIESSYNSFLNGSFASPLFPGEYKMDGDVHYYHLINSGGGSIRLSFDDWNFDHSSSLRIYSGSSTPKTYYGYQSRPFIVSEGSDMIVEFHTSERDSLALATPYMGFRASYVFLKTLDDDWPEKPTNVLESYLYDIRGARPISCQCSYPGANEWIDYLWVIPRTSRQGFNHILRLRLGELTLNDEGGESLEIRKGNSSSGELLRWDKGISTYSEVNGFYIRLRQHCSSYPRKFSATLEWTPDANTKSCGAFGLTYCIRSSEIICRSQLCDGVLDCLDKSDEQRCSSSTTMRYTTRRSHEPSEPDYGNYTFLSILMPLIVVGVITLTISCIIVVCMVRRRRYFTRRRRILREHIERRCQTESNRASTDSSFSMYNTDQPLCPPSYEDTLIFDNRGFADENITDRTLPVHPPPYSEVIKPDQEPTVALSAVLPTYTDVERAPAPQTRLSLPPLLPHNNRITSVTFRPPASLSNAAHTTFGDSSVNTNRSEDGAIFLLSSADNAGILNSAESDQIDASDLTNNSTNAISISNPSVDDNLINAGIVSDSLDICIPLSAVEQSCDAARSFEA